MLWLEVSGGGRSSDYILRGKNLIMEIHQLSFSPLGLFLFFFFFIPVTIFNFFNLIQVGVQTQSIQDVPF